MGQLAVFYAISQGLNGISTALVGVRANFIRGIHLQKVFQLPIDENSAKYPYHCAELEMQEIKCQTLLLHGIRTLDVLSIDEAGQVYYEKLSAIDDILRK